MSIIAKRWWNIDNRIIEPAISSSGWMIITTSTAWSNPILNTKMEFCGANDLFNTLNISLAWT